MNSKTAEWRPGPSVCRCCLSEGCYKDISTEYFWMGKREVYAEMLADTFDLTIAYSKSKGPNSNSRLICEPCISRLRDATDFKRQVRECERTFLQHLDPEGSSDLTALEVTAEPLSKLVKLEEGEEIKEENLASDFDDADDIPDFGDDDDDDDLDDQPLTTLASKTPKKESVDFTDLLDNAKAEKRKSSSKAKASPAKKVKTKKEKVVAKPKPEKKKKGEADAKTPETSKTSLQIIWKKKRRIMGDKANAAFLLEHSNAVPFRWMRGKFMCAYCPQIYPNVSEIRLHAATHKRMDIFENPEVRNSFPLKVDVTDLCCSICQQVVQNVLDLKKHLTDKHAQNVDPEYNDGIVPFILTGKTFMCALCGRHYEGFMKLFIHMNEHFQSFVCHTCGKSYSGKHKLRSHQKCHEIGQFPCPKCDMVFKNRVLKNRHLAITHGPKKRYRCPICDMTFDSCHGRLKHLAVVHGQKSEYRCSMCPSVFGSGTSRYSHMRIVHKMQSADKMALS